MQQMVKIIQLVEAVEVIILILGKQEKEVQVL